MVYTEAATGAYVVTPVLAALAGARHVFAVTRSTAYGTVEEVAALTTRLARLVGCVDCIQVVGAKRQQDVAQADIITNSGHVRPLDRETIGWMKSGAVIPLMYESWELRPGEVDLEACSRQGVRVAGTNERHPNVDVFSYLGVMAVKLLLDAGIAVYQSRVLVICDNPFAKFIERGLVSAGAGVMMAESLTDSIPDCGIDAVMIACKPHTELVVTEAEASQIASRWPGAVVAQYWGDIDRDALTAAGVAFWPTKGPHRGHMGVLPSAVGPEAIVRLQSGGLKVAEVLLRQPPVGPGSDWGYVDAL